jgi:outer membrane protein OmpA-like peptidoglycan-associated protein
MYNIVFIGIAYLFTVVALCAQEAIAIDGHADCKTALDIKIQKVFGPTTAPEGAGKVLEFKDKRIKSNYLVEKEKHSVWYTFRTQVNAEFVFSIEPLAINNDYDFALYEYTDSNFCQDLVEQKSTPIRTNFARNDSKLNSWTGLSVDAKELFVRPGINSSFSKSIRVERGKRYYLMLNNVYKKGKGHKLHFDYQRPVKVSVKVLDKHSGKLLVAGVQLIDSTRQKILKECTTVGTGRAAWETGISLSKFNQPLELKVQYPGYKTQRIKTSAAELLKRDGNPIIVYIENKVVEDNYPIIMPIYISGKVHVENSENQGAEVILRAAKTGDLITKTLSDTTTGNYSLLVSDSIPKSIRVQIYKKGHFFSDTIISKASLRKKSRNGITIKHRLASIEKGKAFRVKQILFEGNRATILPSSKESMNILLRIMKDNPKLHILVEGHTNGNSLGRVFSLKLSKDRGVFICDFLKENGIQASRLKFKGYGGTRMLYPMGDVREFLNRRVEIVVLKN